MAVIIIKDVTKRNERKIIDKKDALYYSDWVDHNIILTGCV